MMLVFHINWTAYMVGITKANLAGGMGESGNTEKSIKFNHLPAWYSHMVASYELA